MTRSMCDLHIADVSASSGRMSQVSIGSLGVAFASSLFNFMAGAVLTHVVNAFGMVMRVHLDKLFRLLSVLS